MSRLWWVYMTEVYLRSICWSFLFFLRQENICDGFTSLQNNWKKPKEKKKEIRHFHLLKKKKKLVRKGFWINFFHSSSVADFNLVKIMWKTRKRKRAVKLWANGIATTRISPTHSPSPHARGLVIQNARFANGFRSGNLYPKSFSQENLGQHCTEMRIQN